MSYFFYWLVVGFGFLIFEIGHPGLFACLSFAIGSLVAAVTSVWINSFVMQGYAFLIGTMISFIILRYYVAHYVQRNQVHHNTNIYALQGKNASVLTAIKPGMAGTVKIGGEVWSARAIGEQEHIDVGMKVEIVAVIGSHVKVKKIISQKG